MTFKYRLTDEDFLAFNRHYLITSEAGQKQLRRQFLMGPIFAVVLFVMLFIMGTKPMLLVIEAVLMIVICLVMYVRRFDSVMKTIEKNLERNNKKGRLTYNRSGEMHFTEDGVVEKQDDAKQTVNMPYDEIKVIYETGTAFYVYTSPTAAILIPKSMCEDEVTLAKVTDHLKEKTNAHWIEAEF